MFDLFMEHKEFTRPIWYKYLFKLLNISMSYLYYKIIIKKIQLLKVIIPFPI